MDLLTLLWGVAIRFNLAWTIKGILTGRPQAAARVAIAGIASAYELVIKRADTRNIYTRYSGGKSSCALIRVQPQAVRKEQGAVVHICERICTTAESDGIGLDVPAYRGVVIAEVVVVFTQKSKGVLA